MNFATVTFWSFFIVVSIAYWSLAMLPRSWRSRKVILLVASYFFYMSWNWKLAGLIVFSTVLDYIVGCVLDGASKRRTRTVALVCSLVGNLGMLALFKYANFFLDSAMHLAETVGIPATRPTLQIILPVGISFYTFQTLSYTIDLYRRKIERCRSFLDFALFVAFFPQLVAGPIVRASHFLPQLVRPPSVTGDGLKAGGWRILRGLVKKVVIADQVAFLADAVFGAPAEFGFVATWIGVLCFAVQIYCDFSGYSDIAIGLGALMGFHLPENFEHPYIAQSVPEFWKRWHISLSSWLRDYLYIPLGGNRHGRFATYRNLMITMLLGGLWHGAAWTFVVWGAYQGFFLSVSRAFERRSPGAKDVDAGGLTAVYLRVFGTFVVTAFGWVLFRAESFMDVITIWKRMLGLEGAEAVGSLRTGILWLTVPVLVTHLVELHREQERWVLPVPMMLRAAVVTGCIILLLSFWGKASDFIYFQF